MKHLTTSLLILFMATIAMASSNNRAHIRVRRDGSATVYRQGAVPQDGVVEDGNRVREINSGRVWNSRGRCVENCEGPTTDRHGMPAQDGISSGTTDYSGYTAD